jgi:protein-disulfide isomerase
MAEEKIEHEHEHHESKTVSIKKSTLWVIGVFVLLALLVASIFTGGFGIVKSGNANAGTGNAAANTGAATATPTISSSTFSDPTLFPTLGPSSAKASVVELGDFQCIWCALASGLPSWASTSTTNPTAQQMISQSGDLMGAAGNLEQLAQQGKIQFTFVPLSFLGQESVYAAEAGMCALDQGKFWQMHDAIYSASNAPAEDTGKYTKANLTILAQGISGMDMTKFNTCLNTDADLARVNQVMTDTQNSGLQIGTPQFFVNGKSVSPSWAALQTAINAA